MYEQVELLGLAKFEIQESQRSIGKYACAGQQND